MTGASAAAVPLPARPPRILVVEDNDALATGLRNNLEFEGYHALVAPDAASGLAAARAFAPDLIILDLMLPDADGFRVLRALRSAGDATPVLVLTALGDEADKVRGLRVGADDYVTKPFGLLELLARVEALLRRAEAGGAAPEDEVYADARLVVDFARHHATVDGREVQLSPLEFRLLGAFVRNRDHVLSHEQLLELAWRDPLAASRDTLKTYVRYLRRKLGWSDGGPIESVRGVGYRYRQG
jgi:DNA-binding response OmpR family regulator